MPLADTLRTHLQQLVTSHPVLLFMKGDRNAPACGFSAQVIQILEDVGPTYETVNVLADPALRDGIKEFSNWPTIPQLYVKGEFVGGCDIVKDMFASGELQTLLGKAEPPATPPKVTFTAVAAAEISKAAGEVAGELLRFEVSPKFENDLYFDAREDSDFVVDAGPFQILVDKKSSKRVNGTTIDFVPGDKGGFKIENPNEPPRVRSMSAKDLSRMLASGEIHELFDVRPEVERKQASIAAARPLDPAGIAHLEALPKTTPIVFQCHHGVRSRAAAEEALRIGFTRVYNLEGGIAAWSDDVDPTVPRY